MFHFVTKFLPQFDRRRKPVDSGTESVSRSLVLIHPLLTTGSFNRASRCGDLNLSFARNRSLASGIGQVLSRNCCLWTLMLLFWSRLVGRLVRGSLTLSCSSNEFGSSTDFVSALSFASEGLVASEASAANGLLNQRACLIAASEGVSWRLSGSFGYRFRWKLGHEMSSGSCRSMALVCSSEAVKTQSYVSVA